LNKIEIRILKLNLKYSNLIDYKNNNKHYGYANDDNDDSHVENDNDNNLNENSCKNEDMNEKIKVENRLKVDSEIERIGHLIKNFNDSDDNMDVQGTETDKRPYTDIQVTGNTDIQVTNNINIDGEGNDKEENNERNEIKDSVYHINNNNGDDNKSNGDIGIFIYMYLYIYIYIYI
jgi:hypothetical protein